uniref:Putative reverse transcriptase n=1 Tax=Oryza sativa subsp. japonica TaxID=39947 RepID=Q6UUK4_ORYSJ|nr:putative reverse transcriptase [Oryza sativa Japonica Group]
MATDLSQSLDLRNLYWHPYPEWFERVPLPNRFKVLDFSKFSAQDSVSTYEHVSRFLAQCDEASAVDALRVRLFPLSLSGSAFTWFSSLSYGSINSWADLEKQFHSYFYSGVHEMKLSDLTAIRQRHDEPVQDYIQRFREMRNKCYSLSLTDAQLADLVFQGMIALIKEKFSSQDFDSLSHLAQKVTLHEQRFAEARKNFKKVSHICPYIYGSDDDDDDDSTVAAAEWVRSKKVIPCQWVKSSGKEERQQIQAAIEDGKIKFDYSKKPMRVDGNPFPVNMVHTAGRTADGGKARGFQVNSAKIINKYQRKYGKQQQEKYYGEDDGGFDPHWGCEFFRFCWNEGMRLPSIEDCPGCSNVAESSNRSYNRNNRLRQTRKAKPRQEWRVKKLAVVADEPEADEEKRLAKGKSVVTASINMVFTLPAKFGAKQADVDEVEEASARLVLSPEQAVFEKPEGTENRHLKPLYINGYVNGKPMSKMMVDGGASVNLMPYATFRKLGRNVEDLIKTNMVLKDFSGNPSETKEMDGLDCLSGKVWEGDFLKVSDCDIQPLKMESPSYYFEGVVEGSNVYTKDTVDDLDDKTKLIELLKEFRDCFVWEYYKMPGLSRSIVEHRLPIKPGVRPHQQPPRRCKANMLEPVKAEIKRLYYACFIRPYRYAEWVSSIVPVIKKNGKVRVCIGFRDLNKATQKDEYPMPVADQLVDAASGHKILSFMDGNAGYNQIFMAEEDIHKTAFRCPGAIVLFEWVVMTFGLKSAGATYQRAMNYIYHDLISWLVEVYIDDVVVKSKEIEDHIADLKKVFERTRKYGLKMNPTKCAFGVSAGQFLGFLVHERGIEITQRSVNAIKKIQPLENKTELLILLEEHQKALDSIKEYLSSPPVLIPPQKGIPFRLYLSAGRVGKWIFSLTEFDLRYESPKAVKGQAIADFIVDHRDDSIGLVEVVPWTLFFDGSVCTHGCGIGLVIISPRGASFEFAYTIKPYATNNQAEYEAVLKGLQLLKEVEADAVEIMGDSLLVVSQLVGEYECKNDTLMVYNEKCQELMKEFRLVTLKHVSREQNVEANDLAKGASGYKPMMKYVKIEVATLTADDWRYDVHHYLQNPSQSASRKLRYRALKYTLLDDELYYRTIDGVLLKCLNADQAKVAIGEFADSMGIKLLNSSPYYAQANGQAEASNKSLIKLIKRKISDYPRQWHTRLAEALWSYRMACHGSIQVPPYKLVSGHEAVLPWEVRIGSRRTELQNDLTADEYYNLMADEREDLVQLRLRALAKATKDKERVVVPKSFSEGELVWKLILPIGTRDNKFSKWSPNWEAPFQIYKVVSKGAYMLQGLDGDVYGRALNGKYLKKYYPSVWVNA